MGRDAEGCCEACKLFGDAPAASEPEAPPPLRATYETVKLIVTEKGGAPTEVFPTAAQVRAGRVSLNEVVLPSGTISKRQFTLTFGDREVVLVDNKSACGTYINGRIATAPTVVPEGATIHAGDFAIRIVPR